MVMQEIAPIVFKPFSNTSSGRCGGELHVSLALPSFLSQDNRRGQSGSLTDLRDTSQTCPLNSSYGHAASWQSNLTPHPPGISNQGLGEVQTCTRSCVASWMHNSYHCYVHTVNTVNKYTPMLVVTHTLDTKQNRIPEWLLVCLGTVWNFGCVSYLRNRVDYCWTTPFPLKRPTYHHAPCHSLHFLLRVNSSSQVITCWQNTNISETCSLGIIC